MKFAIDFDYLNVVDPAGKTGTCTNKRKDKRISSIDHFVAQDATLNNNFLFYSYLAVCFKNCFLRRVTSVSQDK